MAAIIYGASVYNKLPADMIGGFAVIMIMGIFLGDIGMRIPILKISVSSNTFVIYSIITCIFNWMNPASMEAATMLMKKSNFYIYIFLV